jgi:hypothetical protein
MPGMCDSLNVICKGHEKLGLLLLANNLILKKLSRRLIFVYRYYKILVIEPGSWGLNHVPNHR